MPLGLRAVLNSNLLSMRAESGARFNPRPSVHRPEKWAPSSGKWIGPKKIHPVLRGWKFPPAKIASVLGQRVLSLGEQQGQFGAQLPVWRAGWMNRVVIAGYVCAHWLVAELEDPTNAATNGYGPLLTRCSQPVRGDQW
jgi:hypothetical protein